MEEKYVCIRPSSTFSYRGPLGPGVRLAVGFAAMGRLSLEVFAVLFVGDEEGSSFAEDGMLA